VYLGGVLVWSDVWVWSIVVLVGRWWSWPTWVV
jgi:hypothetical protein